MPSTVTGLSPASGPTGGGGGVAIYGTNFTGASAVTFGGVAASEFDVMSATEIMAQAPVHAAGVVDVTVTDQGVTSATSSADHYTYNAPAGPAVTGVSPSSGTTAGGAYVTIDGSGFVSGATSVSFGGFASNMVDVMFSTVLDAYAPAHGAGLVNVTVTTTYGTSAVVTADQYTYVAPPPPAVTGVSPSSGPTAGGTSVTISGNNFTGATAVTFGGVAAMNFDVTLSTEIMAEAPADTAGVVDITVTTAGGTSATSAYDHFTYNPPPPTAVNDSYTLLHDHALNVAAAGVLANDTSPGGLPLSAVLASQPQHGTISLNADGSFIYTPNADYVGTDGFGYYAVANGQDSNVAGVLLTVTDQPPVVSNPGAQQAAVGDQLSLAINASDPGRRRPDLQRQRPAGRAGDKLRHGVVSGTVTAGAAPYGVTVTASDGPESASQSFQWNVGQIVVASPGAQTNAEGDAVSLAITGTSPDGQALTYGVAGLPSGLFLDSGSALISGTLGYTDAETQGGVYSVTITAYDALGGSRSQTFTWNVAHSSTTPTLDNPGDQSNAEGDGVTLQLAGADADGDPLTYSAVGLPAGLTLNAQTGLIAGVVAPGAGASGPDAVTVTASDGTLSDSQSFTWNVSSIFITPMADRSSLEGDAVSVPISAWDLSGQPLTYGAAGLPSGLSIDPNTGVIAGTVGAGTASATPYAVTVTASDVTDSTNTTFNWDVAHLAVNNPGDQTNAEGDIVSLQIGVSDGTAEPLTYSATGLPSGLSIDPNAGLISGTVANLDANAGPYNVTVSAANGGGATDGQSFQWTITHVLIADPGDQIDARGDSVSLAVQASDPDGDTLSYAAANLPAGLSINGATGVISGVVAGTDSGPYAVTVSASDADHTATQAFTWTVTNGAVVVVNPGTRTNAEGDAVALQITATPPAGQSVDAYTAIGLPTGLDIDPASGLISGTVDSAAAETNGGVYDVTVMADDGQGDTGSQAFTWDISHTDQAPVVFNPGDQLNRPNDPVSLAVDGYDPDAGDTLTWSASGLPGGLGIDPATGTISGTLARPTPRASSP